MGTLAAERIKEVLFDKKLFMTCRAAFYRHGNAKTSVYRHIDQHQPGGILTILQQPGNGKHVQGKCQETDHQAAAGSFDRSQCFRSIVIGRFRHNNSLFDMRLIACSCFVVFIQLPFARHLPWTTTRPACTVPAKKIRLSFQLRLCMIRSKAQYFCNRAGLLRQHDQTIHSQCHPGTLRHAVVQCRQQPRIHWNFLPIQ